MAMSSPKPPRKPKKPSGMKMGRMSKSNSVAIPKTNKAPGSPNLKGKKVPNTFGSTQANSVPGLNDSEDMLVP